MVGIFPFVGLVAGDHAVGLDFIEPIAELAVDKTQENIIGLLVKAVAVDLFPGQLIGVSTPTDPISGGFSCRQAR